MPSLSLPVYGSSWEHIEANLEPVKFTSQIQEPALKTVIQVLPKTIVLVIALVLTGAISYADNPPVVVTESLTEEDLTEGSPTEGSPTEEGLTEENSIEAVQTDAVITTDSLASLVPVQGDAEQQIAELIKQDTALLATDRTALLAAIDNSLSYLRTPGAVTAYRDYPVTGITHERVRRSLQRFRTLAAISHSVAELQAAVAAEFDFYQAVGQDGAGTVAFTGYFEPTYQASSMPSETYRYPIYQRPPALDQWSNPHPTRAALEGTDGLQSDSGPLKGLELAWLPTRLEAFLIQVQGSARLEMTDGSTLSVGYDGHTDYPYTSIGRALIDDGIIAADALTLPVLMDYFEQNLAALDSYIPRNNRFVFFRETNGAPATGSLGYPVTAGRSIATDKALMPPGALALINLPLPQANQAAQTDQAEGAEFESSQVTSRLVLDQDTGGAIKGAGRVDLFVGTGAQAGEVAGLINHEGGLYYLMLKDE